MANSNLNVDRLRISRPQPITQNQLPDMPQIPAPLRARYPLWQDYQNELDRWWRNVQALVRAQAVAIKDSE